MGANHISSSKKSVSHKIHTKHYLDDYSGLNYLKNYPLNYFSKFIAIELENTIKEQLEAIDYINELLK